MKLRLGQHVQASDGLFGELSDIVVDPQLRTVTHLVVEPSGQHHLSRLVPIDMVESEGDIINVALGAGEIRQLQRVFFSDYVRIDDPIELEGEWTVAGKRMMSMPFWNLDGYPPPILDPKVTVTYDRIPKGECEIRRTSLVISSDGHRVGQVEGFFADDTHLVAVIVRTGAAGVHRFVPVPISEVVDVTNEEISLAIDRAAFRDLPPTDEIDGPSQNVQEIARRVETGAQRAIECVSRGRQRAEQAVKRRSPVRPMSMVPSVFGRTSTES